MSEMTAIRLAILGTLAAIWLALAAFLWRTSVPSLDEPSLDAAALFGERTLTARALASSLVGSLTRREPEDLAILNKYLHGVVEPRGKEQGGSWPEFLEGGREAIAKLA